MRIRITIDVEADNDAYVDDEVGYAIDDARAALANYRKVHGPKVAVRDVNGNTVGSLTVEVQKPAGHVDCRNCGGDGYSIEGGNCRACKGTGRETQ